MAGACLTQQPGDRHRRRLQLPAVDFLQCLRVAVSPVLTSCLPAAPPHPAPRRPACSNLCYYSWAAGGVGLFFALWIFFMQVGAYLSFDQLVHMCVPAALPFASLPSITSCPLDLLHAAVLRAQPPHSRVRSHCLPAGPVLVDRSRHHRCVRSGRQRCCWHYVYLPACPHQLPGALPQSPALLCCCHCVPAHTFSAMLRISI